MQDEKRKQSVEEKKQVATAAMQTEVEQVEKFEAATWWGGAVLVRLWFEIKRLIDRDK